LFQNFFGVIPTEYRYGYVTRDVTPAEFSNLTNEQKRGQVIWVEGDLEINGGETGTTDAPVILIVKGSLEVGGNGVINGVVYVVDDFDAKGTFAINGSAVIGGAVDNNAGNFTLVYEPQIVGRSSELGPRGARVGTWRDWLN
jgi:hypothetical protein